MCPISNQTVILTQTVIFPWTKETIFVALFLLSLNSFNFDRFV